MDILSNPYAVVFASAIAAGALYYLFAGGFGRTPRRSYCIHEGLQPPDSTRVLRNYRITGNKGLVEEYNSHRTIYSAVQAALKAEPNKRLFGTRSHIKDHTEVKKIRGVEKTWIYPEMGPYKWITAAQFSSQINNIGSALIETGLKPRSNLAVYLETRAEWSTAAQAAFTQNIVVMTVYANLGEEALIFGLNEAECSHIVTTGDLLTSLAKHCEKLHHLKVVIYCDTEKAKKSDIDILRHNNWTLYTFEEFEELGRKHLRPHNPPKEDDLAVLMYTSGSTGMPKGVMCSHSNCMASVGAVLSSVNLRPTDVHLSYLPLAHILAFVVEVGCMASGVAIAYGNARTLSDTAVKNCSGDIVEAKPGFLVGVPTVFDKIKAGIIGKLDKSPKLAKQLFEWAYASKKAASAVGKDTPLWNALVFSKFKGALGGNVRFIVSGGAPLSKECGEFLRVCFGIPVLQGYALTETTAGGTLGESDDLESHLNVGPPIPACEIKLVDCPEMEYTHNDKPEPRGEIWIRGPNVSKGYYKNEEKTKEEFTPDGWFKTGDIGRLNKNGTLSIIDRKKNLIKPPHGEYIAVERLESSYKNSPFVGNIMVHASSDHYDVLALVYPNKPVLESWAEKNNIHKHFPELCEDPAAVKAVLDSLNETWKTTKLKSFERISAIKLYPDEWTPENGWLTAALKIQRQKVQQKEKAVLDRLFADLESK